MKHGWLAKDGSVRPSSALQHASGCPPIVKQPTPEASAVRGTAPFQAWDADWAMG